jgi:hypothetical protein
MKKVPCLLVVVHSRGVNNCATGLNDEAKEWSFLQLETRIT